MRRVGVATIAQYSLLKSIITKPKILKLLILRLFLSTLKTIALSLSLLFSGQLLDSLSTTSERFFLPFKLTIGAIVVYIFLRFFSVFVGIRFRQEFRTSIRDSIFNFIINSPSPLEISAQKSLGYFRTVEARVINGLSSLISFIRSVLSIIVNIIVFNIYNYKIALISLPVIVLFIILPLSISGLQDRLGKRHSQIASAKTRNFLNLINGFTVLSIFESKKTLPSLYKLKMTQLDRQSWIIAAKMSIIAHLFALFFYIFYTLINVVIGYFVSISLLGYGAFLVVNSLGFELLEDGRAIVGDLQGFQQIRGILKEISPPKRKEKEIGVFENITIKDLIFNHKNNSQPLFNHLNLEFLAGKKYALVGPSGCGKSTLGLILLKLHDPPNKSVFWSNIDYENLHFEEITKEATLINGQFTIFASTLRENLTLGEKVGDSELLEVVSLLSLNDIPLDRQINKDSISTGQRQRILLGRALLRNSKLLILDEALANVDRPNAKKILTKLLSDKNLTLINITHHLKNQENYDQVIQLGEKNG